MAPVAVAEAPAGSGGTSRVTPRTMRDRKKREMEFGRPSHCLKIVILDTVNTFLRVRLPAKDARLGGVEHLMV